jgi:hypothetical protein
MPSLVADREDCSDMYSVGKESFDLYTLHVSYVC